MGNCVRGSMSKWGWREVTERFYAATDLVHDNEQFGNRVRQLKALWGFIQNLRNKFTGLGRREDGSVVASDAWWAENTKGHPEWKKLKDGWPEYLPELDRMFLGVAVDGSSAYCAGQNNPTQIISSEEEEDYDDANLTPASCGSKRSTSTRSTGTSPSKKLRSPALRLMDRNMSNFGVIMENKNHVMRDIWNDKKKVIKDKQAALDIKISKVLAMARQVGATEATPDLWIGVMKIIQSERVMSFFIQSTEEGRLAVIRHHAGVGN
ncbi:uncharacterized protein LOC120652624 isoform X2 [Panicum virgatum]|uniref:uncharacterized protein LOC120652624 isoform X2 n=1 Tax=Panicum virgatum TaxID=38727 RepID=UPI0019D61C1C|nr:uncharacterized protein LOC120652624 isoform X2 [Panicum virgatum]